MSTYINTKAIDKMVNKMSNWQRKRWGEAGYPKTKEELEEYINLQKPKREKIIPVICSKELRNKFDSTL